jgi:hypothetical protein
MGGVSAASEASGEEKADILIRLIASCGFNIYLSDNTCYVNSFSEILKGPLQNRLEDGSRI